jgi:hypothetical protein
MEKNRWMKPVYTLLTGRTLKQLSRDSHVRFNEIKEVELLDADDNPGDQHTLDHPVLYHLQDQGVPAR